jgi:predicted RNA methylase
MSDFKFLNNIPDSQDANINPIQRNAPAHYFRTNMRREDIPEEQWYSILRQQRQRLAERMWEEGMVSHSIISQDENGFTLITEFLF